MADRTEVAAIVKGFERRPLEAVARFCMGRHPKPFT
jgi:hypothetical protein